MNLPECNIDFKNAIKQLSTKLIGTGMLLLFQIPPNVYLSKYR